jgi:hypothetical protein
MTRNRKADLQRKLAMAPVATPPAGLADRIKHDIPKHLGVETPAWRRAASLRIAASIVLLASSLYLVTRLVSRSNTQPSTMMMERTAAPSTRVAVALPVTPPEPGSARAQRPADQPAMPSTPPSSVSSPTARMADARHTEAVQMGSGSPQYVDTVETEAPAAKRESIIAGNAAPAPVMAPPPPPPPVDQAAPSMAAEGGSTARERTFSKVAASAPAVPRDAAPPLRTFVAIEDAIKRGEAASNADTSAIVQHFAAPERAPSTLRVEIEASAAPLESTKWLLRVSVDAPDQSGMTIDLVFGDAVASHHALTGSPAANETALYEITFKPEAKPEQTIATVLAGNMERSIRVADLHHWNDASTRMKRASLAAAWARTLQSRTENSQVTAIVTKARQAHIDDLADMAEQAQRNR